MHLLSGSFGRRLVYAKMATNLPMCLRYLIPCGDVSCALALDDVKGHICIPYRVGVLFGNTQ